MNASARTMVAMVVLAAAGTALAQQPPAANAPAGNQPARGGMDFGTTPQEEANRQVVFAWAKAMRVDRAKSYQTYMNVEKYVEHPERNGGFRPQDSKGASMQMPEPKPDAEGRIGQIKFGPNAGAGDNHMLAHVDGAMVTLYWAGGVDLFRVENGKIVNHWTGSPPGTVTVYGPEDSRNRAPPPGAAPPQ